jgi:hypothetical protein
VSPDTARGSLQSVCRRSSDPRRREGSAGKSAPSPNASASGDPIPRITTIARSVARRYPRGLPFGLSVHDLVSEGWLAWHAARAVARTESYPFERARFAMLSAIRTARRSVRVDDQVATRGLDDHQLLATVTAEDMEPAWNDRSPVLRHRLSRVQINDLRACFRRHLNPQAAALMIATVIDGESLALATATHDGKTAPYNLRNNAHRKILQVLVGHRGVRPTRGQCTVSGCFDTTKARGLCRAHYWQQVSSPKRRDRRRAQRSDSRPAA